jgi:hypothetical protein
LKFFLCNCILQRKNFSCFHFFESLHFIISEKNQRNKDAADRRDYLFSIETLGDSAGQKINNQFILLCLFRTQCNCNSFSKLFAWQQLKQRPKDPIEENKIVTWEKVTKIHLPQNKQWTIPSETFLTNLRRRKDHFWQSLE